MRRHAEETARGRVLGKRLDEASHHKRTDGARSIIHSRGKKIASHMGLAQERVTGRR